MRALAKTLSALLLVAALGGCGGHGPFTSATTAAGSARRGAPAARTPSSPSAPLTKPRAEAFARAVNLRARDVPGFAAAGPSGGQEDGRERQLQRRFLACIGRTSLESGQPAPEASSPRFSRRGLLGDSVSSSVSFAASARAAGEELALLRSAKTRRCLTSYLDELFGGRRPGAHPPSFSIRGVTVSQGVPPAPGSSGGFAWRIRADVALKGVLAPFYFDILGFVYRQADVRLESTGLLVPFPAAAQEELFSLLLRRAEATPL